VLLELVSLAALLVLVCIGVFAGERRGRTQESPGSRGEGPRGVLDGYDKPDWWPEFEREFALYVAQREAARRAECASWSRFRRPRRAG
jgi:hypothetical protein